METKLKKSVNILLMVAIVFFNLIPEAPAQFLQIQQFLCELGQRYYQQERYLIALEEFRKVLSLDPDSSLAKDYIQRIEQKLTTSEGEISREEKGPTYPPIKEISSKEEAIKNAFEKFQARPPEAKIEAGRPQPSAAALSVTAPFPTAISIKKLFLDETVRATQPETKLEIEIGKTMIVSGHNITRWLATQPELISIERKSSDEINITGKGIGFTYFHIWDSSGRWTFSLLSAPPKPEGPTLDEQIRMAEERAGTFKLRYALDWASYEQGRRLKSNSLKRQSYRYLHYLTLTGETPYGDLDSSATVQSLKKTTDLTYFTMGLSNGKMGPFKDFTVRSFDYSPAVGNLAWGGANLRGTMFESPAFNKKVDYTIFWGREGGGKYGNLSPGLDKTKKSFLSGLDINYSPKEKQNYGFSVFKGWGGDRPSYLNTYGYDLDIAYHLDKWGLKYEVANNSETFAHLLNTTYTVPKLRFTTELRDIDKNFTSMTGTAYRTGELGALSNLNYEPFEKLGITSSFDVYRDRLYPALDNPRRWNEDFNLNANYTINPLTSLRLDYVLQNELGTLGQFRYQNVGVGLGRTFELLKRISTFVNYRHQENKNFSSPGLDYINEKLYLGLRFSLIGQLYYYLNQEFDWLQERFAGNNSRPKARETGVDWAGQILNSPFYGNFKFMYRDEENTTSNLSFLSGEDYIEGYAEFSYRPNPNTEAYCSTRIRNVWADNPSVNKHIEADFRAGMRYVWDTGVRWEPVGTIDGYVFKDLNSDGLMQRDEAPVEGVRVYLGKDKSQVTDILGYYKFTKVRARKAYISVDTTTIPSGFILTVPSTQKVTVAHDQEARVNFGISSRTEVTGVVFEDIDGDGQLGPRDLGVKDITLFLEDGTKAVTDDSGRYYFGRINVGEHNVTLDLKSLPLQYIPAVPLFKKVEVFEGVSYIYNIPLRKTAE